MDYELGPEQQALREQVEEVCWQHVRPHAAAVDREGRFPAESLRALAEIGLWGLVVPRQHGGLGHGLHLYAVVVEEIARACASTAMVFVMHSAAAAVLAARATPVLAERYLGPIARGERLATLAFSEAGSGCYFWVPATEAVPAEGGYRLTGKKAFVTSAGLADLYVLNARVPGARGPADATLFVAEKGAAGLERAGEWTGVGMRGNHSAPMALSGVAVPEWARVGAEGEGLRLMRETVLPMGQAGISAVNLGIARAAFEAALAHVRGRTYKHLQGQGPGSFQTVQFQLAEMRLAIDRARCLLDRTLRKLEGQRREVEDVLDLLQLKVAACEAVQEVVHRAVRLCGGSAFAGHLPVERHLRDSLAGAVMAPTVDVLKDYIGKTLVGIPAML